MTYQPVTVDCESPGCDRQLVNVDPRHLPNLLAGGSWRCRYCNHHDTDTPED